MIKYNVFCTECHKEVPKTDSMFVIEDDDIGMTVFEKFEQLHKYTYVDRFNICDECYNKENEDE